MLRRSAEERDPIVHRLRRLEGQVRGLQQMVEQDRYCLDEIQQANAVVAAMREVALMIATQHLAVGIERAADEHREALLADMRAVLRAAMKQA